MRSRHDEGGLSTEKSSEMVWLKDTGNKMHNVHCQIAYFPEL